jgi:hypothetical protein
MVLELKTLLKTIAEKETIEESTLIFIDALIEDLKKDHHNSQAIINLAISLQMQRIAIAQAVATNIVTS